MRSQAPHPKNTTIETSSCSAAFSKLKKPEGTLRLHLAFHEQQYFLF
jgi:hypothetical protein